MNQGLLMEIVLARVMEIVFSGVLLPGKVLLLALHTFHHPVVEVVGSGSNISATNWIKVA